MALIYLDYSSSTPVLPEVAQAMSDCLTQEGCFANPHSSHQAGMLAAEIVKSARRKVAECIGAEASQIIWTSGATEANNLAIKGSAWASKRRHMITVQTEHKSVLDPCDFLAENGYEVTYLPVNSNGLLDLNELKKAIRPDTFLISVMMVNNETGVIQNIAEMVKLAHQHDVLFHSDAAQAFGKLPIDVGQLDVDLMSFSAHKAYGPKGIGALYCHPRVNKLMPLIHGGGHENNKRSGTLATHQIVGMGKAFELVYAEMSNEIQRLAGLKKYLWQGLEKIGGVSINGEYVHSAPHILNVSFEGVNNEVLLGSLPELALSTASTCTMASHEPSHVLKAMKKSLAQIEGSIRISLGKYTTLSEIEQALSLIKQSVDSIRKSGNLWSK
jgi:cysteine desulfurase